jgi:hypothetical protein
MAVGGISASDTTVTATASAAPVAEISAPVKGLAPEATCSPLVAGRVMSVERISAPSEVVSLFVAGTPVPVE